ncbi:hypothetical protein ACFY0Z_30095 [Streptomyces kronopolitis]|uniref:hypothetical protein n=1 Tax=Streptomyces kronopolitis TaxID=1612435 RepID=UPI0036A37EC8
MFTQSTSHANGTASTNAANEMHAASLLRRAVRRNFSVEATRYGGVLIRWEARGFGPMDGQITRFPRSITLSPLCPVRALSDTQLRDLDVINSYGTRFVPGTGRIEADLFHVPPATTARLLCSVLVVVDPSVGRARLSLPARLALHARDHQTSTAQPRGWYHPADGPRSFARSAGLNKPGRRSGLMHDRSSSVSCACGGLFAFAEDREDARRQACAHRQEATRDLLASPGFFDDFITP